MKILYIEDNPGDVRLIKEILSQSPGKFAIDSAGSLEEGLKANQSAAFDVVLLDMNLPDSRGMETLTTLLDVTPDIPVVIMTSIDDEEAAEKAVRLGAQDYLVKGQLDNVLLRRVLTYAIERQQIRQDLERRTLALATANKELEAFSYSVAHDLRAPLRALDGYSQALLEHYSDKLDESGRKWLGRIRNSSQFMARLIDDLLGLSRVIRAELVMGPVDLSEMALAISAKLKADCPERLVEFKIAPGIEACGDRNLLLLAMQNLLDNAFKFTGGSRQTKIEFGIAQSDGRQVYFVRDNGAGFDMQYANKLFEPFQRLHSNREFPGTGIGLAIVQRIIKRHGGKIWAEGKVGQGATLSFTLGKPPPC